MNKDQALARMRAAIDRKLQPRAVRHDVPGAGRPGGSAGGARQAGSESPTANTGASHEGRTTAGEPGATSPAGEPAVAELELFWIGYANERDGQGIPFRRQIKIPAEIVETISADQITEPVMLIVKRPRASDWL